MNTMVKEFLFDLRNSANENGFKPGETWDLKLVSDADRKAIEQQYQITLSQKGEPQELLDLYYPVHDQLKLKTVEIPTAHHMQLDKINYLIAYNAGREKH